MYTGRRHSDNDEDSAEDDILLDLCRTPWEREFTRRFLKVEKQQQQQTDIMRMGKIGFRFLVALSGLGSTVAAFGYYLLHWRLP